MVLAPLVRQFQNVFETQFDLGRHIWKLHYHNHSIIKVLLPKFFSTFKHSFSYGEGCLVLQSLVVFVVKTFLCVINDENDPSKVDGSFNIIANVGLISALVLCSVPYIPLLSFINSSNVFYLTGE